MDISAIEQFLDLVANPDKYKKALVDLKAEQDRLQVLIELTGKIGEIQSMHLEAAEELEQAKLAADAVRAEAERVATGKLSELNGRLQELTARESTLTDELSAAKEATKQAKAKLKDLDKREDLIVIREADIVARTGHLDLATADLNARAEKLRQALN